MNLNEPIVIGGRAFDIPPDRTIGNDIFVEQQAMKAGLRDLHIEENETYDQFAERLLTLAMRSGVMMDLLGALLIPRGTEVEDWTPQLAHETGAFLTRLKGAEEKSVIRAVLAAALAAFFEREIARATISPSSSIARAGSSPATSPDPSRADQSAGELEHLEPKGEA